MSERKDSPSRVRPPLPPFGEAWPGWSLALLWSLGVAGFAGRLLLAWQHPAADFYAVWVAVDAFLHGRSPYTGTGRANVLQFLYPPSSLLVFAPFGALSFERAREIFLVVQALCIVLAGWLCLRLFRVPWAPAWGAVALLTLTLYAPVTQTLQSGNVNGLVLLGEVAMLLAAARGHWVVAGVCLGSTLAIKPVLLPLLVLPLLERRWLAMVIALAIPGALWALAGLAGPQAALPDHFVSLLSGDSSRFQIVSLEGTGAVLGVPGSVVLAARLLVLAVAAVTLWRWRRPRGDEALRLAKLSGLALTTTFLVTTMVSWGHYAIYLLPLLASTIRGGPVRGWLGALAVYGLGAPDVRLWLAGPRGPVFWQLRVTLGLVLTLIALARSAWSDGRRKPPTAEPPSVSDSARST